MNSSRSTIPAQLRVDIPGSGPGQALGKALPLALHADEQAGCSETLAGDPREASNYY